MSSSEFQRLSTDVDRLKTNLMNFAPRLDGAYTDEELLKCQAFIVFSHAEIETYLESIARKISAQAESNWKSAQTYNRVIVSLLAFHGHETLRPPQDPMYAPKQGTLAQLIEDAFKSHEDSIGDNNGIRRFNLSAILCPLGVLPSDLDEVLLIQLDKTGKHRGDIVHKANKVSIHNVRDPFADEQTDIENLLKELERLDLRLQTIGLLP